MEDARGSIFAPRLGLHVHVALRHGALAEVRIRRAPQAEPADPPTATLLTRIARHLESGRERFDDVPLDLASLSPFDQEVLGTLMRKVGPGEVATYAELARMTNRDGGAARAIGGAMARNPLPIVIPCHRVVPAGDRIGNYSGEGGWQTKMALLRLEGAKGVWAQRRLWDQGQPARPLGGRVPHVEHEAGHAFDAVGVPEYLLLDPQSRLQRG